MSEANTTNTVNTAEEKTQLSDTDIVTLENETIHCSDIKILRIDLLKLSNTFNGIFKKINDFNYTYPNVFSVKEVISRVDLDKQNRLAEYLSPKWVIEACHSEQATFLIDMQGNHAFDLFFRCEYRISAEHLLKHFYVVVEYNTKCNGDFNPINVSSIRFNDKRAVIRDEEGRIIYSFLLEPETFTDTRISNLWYLNTNTWGRLTKLSTKYSLSTIFLEQMNKHGTVA
jgi:hypothetical protein